MSPALSGFISPMQKGGDGYTHATLSVKVVSPQRDLPFAIRLYTAHCGHQSVNAIPVTTFAGLVDAPACYACALAIERRSIG